MLEIEMTVNGRKQRLGINPRDRLIDVLRDTLRLTGAKEGCSGEGECGACTVIMDGQAVNSCLVLAFQARNRQIITIEGLEKNGELDRLQQAFIDQGAVQCGYCTPGMILSAKALLMNNPHPEEAEIRTAIAGNLCRCTGYVKIIRAIQQVAAATDVSGDLSRHFPTGEQKVTSVCGNGGGK
ncbi:(2Fe-2S)-binding protein [Desulfosporosinus sp. PR]|uniref:(2Fe-2S)-binding protein n=1 Tax=Candidatus Desulfosporosinus nitrosoreducens TaxID=3401928 RepID=UPI0027E61BBD|nr:2Fe-2S iron-sulfur cluster-binding protein [Desulfosporosinus sp. PR]MDQ7096339.1 (2Fe-2S)-binding protein [Desulfosporosinus sp. PR]